MLEFGGFGHLLNYLGFCHLASPVPISGYRMVSVEKLDDAIKRTPGWLELMDLDECPCTARQVVPNHYLGPVVPAALPGDAIVAYLRARFDGVGILVQIQAKDGLLELTVPQLWHFGNYLGSQIPTAPPQRTWQQVVAGLCRRSRKIVHYETASQPSNPAAVN